MVTGHENRTYELTNFELNTVLPIVVKAWNTRFEGSTLLMRDMVTGINGYCDRLNIMNEKGSKKLRVTDVRMRKIFHHIRVYDLLKMPLLASSKGYYLSNDKEEIQKFINSCIERANSFMEVANSLKNQNI